MNLALLSAIVAAMTITLGASGAVSATYTCAVVAKRGDLDPGGFPFSNKFDERVAINESGDTLFVGRAGKNQQALYLYPGVGPNTVIARVGDPAPGGSAFGKFARGTFGNLSLNTPGDAAFVGRLTLPGEGVFVLDGGVLEKAAQTADLSPSGGTFLSFPSLSTIRDTGEVIFVGNVTGGPSGIFQYSAVSNLVVPLLDTTDVDDGGRPFCAFQKVGMSDGVAGFIATVGVPDCTTPVQGVFYLPSPGVGEKIALVGEPSAIGGTVFTAFIDAPQTSSTAITFAARVTGAPFTGDAIFGWDGLMIDKIVAVGDAAPVAGGALKKLGGQFRQTLGNEVFAHFYTRQASATQGIFSFDGTLDAPLLKTDVPPAPFGVGSKFRTLGPPAVDGAGTYLGLLAQVKDTIKPSGKDGILRCQP